MHRFLLHNDEIREAAETSLAAGPGRAAGRMGRFFNAARIRWRDVRLGEALGSDEARRGADARAVSFRRAMAVSTD